MVNAKDMWFIKTRKRQDHDWTIRMQSISKEYLISRGREWTRLGFISDYEIFQKEEQ